MAVNDKKLSELGLITAGSFPSTGLFYVVDPALGTAGSKGMQKSELVLELKENFYDEGEVDGLLVTKADVSHTHDFASLTSKPTTLAGYGITDAAPLVHSHTFASLTSKPTTLSGYGITDAAAASHTHVWADIGGTPTTLAGYGITDAAPLSHSHAASDISSGTLAAARMPAHTGDVTSTVGTVALTVAANVVDNTKLADMAANSIKLNNTAGVASPIDGTIAQLNAMINSTVAPTFANVSGKPTTLAGYGITDAATSGHTHTFASLTSKPTTLAGYGITDAAASTHTHAATDISSGTLPTARMPALTGDVTSTVNTVATTIANDAVTNAKLANMAANSIKLNNTGSAADPIDGTIAQLNAMINSTVAPTFANVSGKPTTLSGYGITDAAPLASPTFTGTPAAPTASVGTNTTQLATTAFVQTAVTTPPAWTAKTSNYTLALADAGGVIAMNMAGANTWTVPPNSSVAFPLNTEVHGTQYNSGQTTITPGAGVTLRAAGGKLKANAQYSGWTVKKIATDEWVVWGDLSA